LQPFRDAKAQPINKQQRHHNRKTKQRQRIDDTDQAGIEDIAVSKQNGRRAESSVILSRSGNSPANGPLAHCAG
jgi:hypothetical protein